MTRLLCFFFLLHVALMTSVGYAQDLPDPTPEDGIDFILERFEDVSLVAIGETHGLQEMYAFYHALVDDTRFQETVNDVVIEFGNARYQDVLDRYINGEPISEAELRPLWRDHTNTLIADGDDPLLYGLLQKIRQVNRELPMEHRLRVLAGDPPVNWETIRSGQDFWPYLGQRDRHYAKVVWDNVLDKGRKALLIMGRIHFKKIDPSPPNYVNLLRLLDARKPNGTYVIHLWKASTDRVAWPSGVIAPIAGTWLGDTRPEDDAPDIRLEDQIDAVLYLGPAQTWTTVAATPYEPRFLAELSRRSWLVQNKPYRMLIYGALQYWMHEKGITAAMEEAHHQYQVEPPLYDFSAWQFEVLGQAFIQAEKLAEALAVHQLGVAFYPASPQAHTSLARTYALQGNTAQARHHFEEALKQDPAFEGARDGLAQLEEKP